LRGAGSDYLAYSLIDAVVDRYYPLIERFGQELDQLETRVYDGEDVITEIAGVQKALSQLRRNLWPTRQALGDLAREGRGHALSVQTQPYLRDAYDHAARLVELTESLREGAATLMDTHMGLASHRLGESMKVLTTIATIFMPLSFLAGLYGMNFDRTSPFNMPELGWRYGYVALLAVMGVLTAALVIVFRRKRWL
jgi:magnesium transporter